MLQFILLFILIFPSVYAEDTEKIEVLGSRIRYRTTGDTAVPVDIITSKDLKEAGISETGRLLQMISASFNFSSTTVSDGTDIVRPATLRGMGPDQVLILINGKRRHSQALVNVQQTIGRGSAGTDINAIPITAIDSVHILRDGAAAQYGSDAISGVINFILKSSKGSDHSELNAYSGQNYFGDGAQNRIGLAGNLWSRIRLTAEARLRGESNRAQTDSRHGRQTMKIGEAKSDNYSVFFNGEFPVAETGELYIFGGASKRQGLSAGFFREPAGDRNLSQVYPEGFLPKLVTTVEDQSVFLGYKWHIHPEWAIDTSVSSGRNAFNFSSRDSLNVSLGAGSPTATDDGTLVYQDINLNIDLEGEFEAGWTYPVSVLLGTAVRDENYQILAGDFESYAYGPNNDLSQTILGQNGERAAPGIQGFPGFQPSDSASNSRKSQALYLSLESYLTDKWLLAMAARNENYEKAGSSTTGKLSSRYDISGVFAVRGALSTGFRAPSLQQVSYSSHSTTFAQNKLTETQTAPQGSAPFTALGLPDLKNETSLSTSAGVVWQYSKATQLTLDYYSIVINDRIVLSGMLEPEDSASCTNPADCPIRQVLDPLNLGAVQFFTNAIDTRTNGLDIVFSHVFDFNESGRLKLLTIGHINETKVNKIRTRGVIPAGVIFDEAQVVLTEEGQPKQRFTLGLDYLFGKWNLVNRFNYFGAVAGQGFGNYKQSFAGKWITDFSGSYRFSDSLRWTLGANNLFNVYPDELDANHPIRTFAGGSFKYSWETAPFGFTGGFYYTKLEYLF